MARTLLNNVNSNYFNALNALKGKTHRQRIVAYVESYDDVSFWRNILDAYENDKRYFEVMLPSHQNLTKGKKRVLANLLQENMGEHMIACVDADYDYLLQGATPTSKTVINNAFVLHTYAYAIENLQCYAPSLHRLCVMATLNDRNSFQFEQFLESYSKIIYPLFVWNIWHYRKLKYKDFSMSDLLSIIDLGSIDLRNVSKSLEQLELRVSKKVERLQRHLPYALKEYEELKQELRQIGVQSHNTYLYIQGHFLLDNIVLPLLKQVCAKLRTEREREIMRRAVHDVQYNNELSGYKHSVEDVQLLLKRHTGFMQSDIYQKINDDVRRILKI